MSYFSCLFYLLRDFFFSFFQLHLWHIEVSGQGLNLGCGCNLCDIYSNSGSLTHCPRPGIQSELPLQPTPQGRQYQILNRVHHSGNSCFMIFLIHFYLFSICFYLLCFFGRSVYIFWAVPVAYRSS